MKKEKIMRKYNVPLEIARFLSNVRESKDYRDYENRKSDLMRLCRGNLVLYKKSHKGLIDLMRI